MILTNKSRSLQKTIVCETGRSTHHKLTATVLTWTFAKLSAKTIRHGSYKHLKENSFCRQLDKILIQDELYRSSYTYSEVTEIFSILLEKDPAIKSKKIRENHAPFIKKELIKTEEKYARCKKEINKFSALVKKIWNNIYLKTIDTNKHKTGRAFWDATIPFVTNKGTKR